MKRPPLVVEGWPGRLALVQERTGAVKRGSRLVFLAGVPRCGHLCPVCGWRAESPP